MHICIQWDTRTQLLPLGSSILTHRYFIPTCLFSSLPHFVTSHGYGKDGAWFKSALFLVLVLPLSFRLFQIVMCVRVCTCGEMKFSPMDNLFAMDISGCVCSQ